MPNAVGRAFSTANFLSNLTALKAINFGSADPPGVWFVVPNSSTNNIEIWVWQPTSMAATNEISVVRPDSVPPSSPGRCIQSLRFDASTLGGILGAIASLNTAGLIERTADGSASIVGLSSFGRTFLGSASDAAARTALSLGNVTDTSDINKPVSTAQQTALNLKANLASPAFTGTPTVPTAAAGTNTTQAASTAFVMTGLALKANLASPAFTGTPTVPTAAAGTNTTQAASTAFVSTALAALVNSSPAVLDTLGELASALGNDANFATTVTANLAAKVSIASNLSDLNNRQTALNNLAGQTTANRVLKGNGTNILLGQVDLANDVTGNLPLINGSNFVNISLNQNIGGQKVFTDSTATTSSTTGAVVVNGGFAADGITTGSHIRFPAIQIPSSEVNILDDYEEGTWTPVLTYTSPGTSSITFSRNTGRYQKIGNRVEITFDIRVSSYTKGTATGFFIISGLPFPKRAGGGFDNNYGFLVVGNAPFTGIPFLDTGNGLAGNGNFIFIFKAVANLVNQPLEDPINGAIYWGQIRYEAAN